MGELPEGLLEEALRDFKRLVTPLLRYFPYADKEATVKSDVTTGSVHVLQFPFQMYLSDNDFRFRFILCPKSAWEKVRQEYTLLSMTTLPDTLPSGDYTWMDISDFDEGDIQGIEEKIVLPLLQPDTYECMRGLPTYKETRQELKENPESIVGLLGETSFRAFVAKDILGVE